MAAQYAILEHRERPKADDLQKALNIAWKGMDKEFRCFSPDKFLTLSLRTLLLAQLPHPDLTCAVPRRQRPPL